MEARMNDHVSSDMETAVLVAVINENYPAAEQMIRSLSRRHRAVLGFYLAEIQELLSRVDMSDPR